MTDEIEVTMEMTLAGLDVFVRGDSPTDIVNGIYRAMEKARREQEADRAGTWGNLGWST